jgi:hypothetical protein
MAAEPSVLAIIADAVQSAYMHRPSLGSGTAHDRSYLSNEDSEYTASAILDRLTTFGYEVRKKEA